MREPGTDQESDVNPARVVVAEDQWVVALDIKCAIERSGHKVVCIVSSGEAAIAKAEELQPDLLVMDIHLEGKIDGLDAVGKIWKGSKMPVIFVTANSDERTLRHPVFSGAASLVSKPFSEMDLRSSIEQALTVKDLTKL
jgi:CheY-like chemotaxis protein